jgi:hypothetical protein
MSISAVCGLSDAGYEMAHGEPNPGSELGDTLSFLLTEDGLDSLSTMFALMSKSSELSVEGQQQQVHTAAREKERAVQEMLSQIKEAMEERENKGFWDDLGSVLGKVAAVVGIVAAVAVTVVSFGSAAPVAALAIAGLALSLAASVESEFKVLEKCGVSPEVAQWVAVGCAIAGALCSLGSGLLASGGTAVKLASDGARYAAEAGKWGNVIAGAAGVGAGGAKITCAAIERDAQQHEIDAYKQQQQAEQLQRMILRLIEELEETVEGDTAKTKRIVSIMDAQGAALTAAAGGMA